MTGLLTIADLEELAEQFDRSTPETFIVPPEVVTALIGRGPRVATRRLERMRNGRYRVRRRPARGADQRWLRFMREMREHAREDADE